MTTEGRRHRREARHLRPSVRGEFLVAWLDHNRDAIAEYNAQVAKRGTFSDDWRRF